MVFGTRIKDKSLILETEFSEESEWKDYVNPAKNSSVQFINVYNKHKRGIELRESSKVE
ncbi:hypothetical protein KJ632_01890 [Patescibacteria group bacterium]|nr:hypothetical protein [Patescibacteria group bacterium]